MTDSQLPAFDPEECRLLVLEEIIERGERTFIEVGKALAEIRDKRLYRKDHKSFEDYCQERWIKGRHWGGRMINAALVVEQLPSKLVTTVTNEATARALSYVPQELRPGVIEHIQDAHKPVNSSTVKEAAQVVPQRTSRVENGKPKSQMAVWQELRDAYGRANNQLPEANRVWPAEEFKYLKDLTHKCFAAVERWHGKVR